MMSRAQAATLRQRASRARKRGAARPLPTFIALDGEGRNTAGIGSAHLYTLLAASTGHYYENVTDGLSTAECCEFLLRMKAAYPRATFVGFAINYDVNMLLRDVPVPLLRRLWQSGRCLWRDKASGMTYRLSYVPSKWVGVSRVERLPSVGKARYKTIASMRVWDVWGFFQKSFVGALGDWLADVPDAIAAIARMKAQRGAFSAADARDVRRYCLDECRLLVRMMDALAAALWGAGLPITQWLGAGALASYLFKQQNVKTTLDWDGLPQGVRDASLWAYFGGRVEIFRQGILPETCYDYDIRSAYPATIATLPTLTGGAWYHWQLPSPYWRDKSGAWGMVHVRWDTRGHPLAWLAPFPQHYASGKVGWEAVGEGWYHMSEYSAAKALFGERIHETEAWELAAYSTGAFTFVEAAYRTRAAYKAANDPRHFPLKVGLNALYGKLAESMTRDPTRRPAYQNFFLAGAVTAATRAKVLGVLAHVGRERAVMAATDGVFLLGADSGSSAGVDPLTGAGVRVGLGLGEWEVSSTPPGMVLAQAGVYWEVPQVGVIPKVRTRGFGVKSVSYDDAARLFRGTAPELSYRETRFIGLGYCVNTGDFSQWRRWVSVERTLSRSLEPYRRVEHGKVVAGVLHDAMQRRPYRPRNVRMTELPERPNAELLDALQMMEQPEGAGD